MELFSIRIRRTFQLVSTVLAKKHEHEDLCGCDKFHMIHPDTDWLAGLRHAEKIGLGTMDYELIKI